ncbi:ComF family protein [Virgibacillus sp. W0181]|uniref:ComF family protein n=1 Tax=Virgibacillus sp. W0181 TaxID=3391581 RepID=UPI003F4548A7
MSCLWCDQEIVSEVSWSNLFLCEKQERLCGECSTSLKFLEGRRCKGCSRESTVDVCPDCLWWERQSDKGDPLTFNISIYVYNEKMKEIISAWKYRGDYCLAAAFKSIFKETFSANLPRFNKNALIVPIPLTEERYLLRGFNQAHVLATYLPLPIHEILHRSGSEKQSKKTRQERLSVNNPFKIATTINKPVILVDDIYTTGTTLRHAARLLKQNGCPEVVSYTLVRG